MSQTTTTWRLAARSQSKLEPYETVQVNLARGCLIDGRPNWDDISFDVHCSRCGYDLRMLTEPRCPECGLSFEWLELVNASLRRSPFLFEHNWRKQPVRSWLMTVGRAFRPRQFWRSVSIHDDIRPGPLWFLLLTGPVLFAVMLTAALYAMSVAGLWLGHVIYGTALPTNLFGWYLSAPPADPLTQVATLLRSMACNMVTGRGAVYWLPQPVVILMATLGMVCTMRQTLNRCRLRRVHLLRIVAYSAAPACVVWAGVYALTLAIGNAALPRTVAIALSVTMIALIAGVPAFYLRGGLKHYLHLPHAAWIAIASSVAAMLLMFVLLTVFVIAVWTLHG